MKTILYRESHKLSPNVFLAFYVYVMFIVALANIAQVSAASYCIFFLLGVAGLLILFSRAAYKITVRKNVLEISVSFIIRIVLQRLDLKEAESIEQLRMVDMESVFKIKKSPRIISYLINLPAAIKVNMPGKKSYIMSTAHPGRLINLANLFIK